MGVRFGSKGRSSSWLTSAVLAAALIGGCGDSASVITVAPPAQVAEAPAAGGLGIGDPVLPRLGNGGYQVEHYTVALQVTDTGRAFSATSTISAVAQQALSQFSLDLRGLEVQEVRVNGSSSTFFRIPGKLVVVPATPIPQGATFKVAVRYSAQPLTYVSDYAPIPIGWIPFAEGSFVLGQPDGASAWMPVNDHPLDKATYTFEVQVDAGLVVAANGELEEVREEGSRRTYVWHSPQPMASYLTTVNVGNFVRREQVGPGGEEIRHYFPLSLLEQADAEFSGTPEKMGTMTELFGPYPFSQYGAVVIDAETHGAALECQTMSLFGRDLLGLPSLEETQIHELAHQWFGDSISLTTWQDIWLNEGFATYATWLWYEEEYGEEAYWAQVRGYYEFLQGSEPGHPVADPPANDLFSTNVYFRGALTLHALREEIGEEAWLEGVRRYVREHSGGHATTAEFIATMEAVAGRSLTDFFDRWLYQVELPELQMPTLRHDSRFQGEFQPVFGCKHRWF